MNYRRLLRLAGIVAMLSACTANTTIVTRPAATPGTPAASPSVTPSPPRTPSPEPSRSVDFEIRPAQLELIAGQAGPLQLLPLRDDDGGLQPAIVWTTSNKQVATVSPRDDRTAIVTTLAAGTITVRASTPSGTWTCLVTVLAGPTPAISASPTASPTASTSPEPSATQQPNALTLLAGSGEPGYQDGKGAAAKFNGPGILDAAPEGHLLVTDTLNGAIRKIDKSGRVTTILRRLDLTAQPRHLNGVVAAPGELSYGAWNDEIVAKRPGGDVTLFERERRGGFGLLRGNADLFISDGQSRIYRLDPNEEWSTLAGGDAPGLVDAEGHLARFDRPRGLSWAYGKVNSDLYVADYGNDRVRVVSIAADGLATVRTIADGRASGTFSHPEQAAPDAHGNVYVACESGLVRVDPRGMVKQVETSPAVPTGLSGVTVGNDGRVYIAVRNGHRIFSLKPASTL